MKQSCVTSVGVWNLSIVTRVQTSHLILWPFFPFTMTDMMDFKETFRNPFIKEATKVGKDFQPHETLRSHARKTTVWSVTWSATPVFVLALMLSHFIKHNFIQTSDAKEGILKTINHTLFFQNCSKHFYLGIIYLDCWISFRSSGSCWWQCLLMSIVTIVMMMLK